MEEDKIKNITGSFVSLVKDEYKYIMIFMFVLLFLFVSSTLSINLRVLSSVFFSNGLFLLFTGFVLFSTGSLIEGNL